MTRFLALALCIFCVALGACTPTIAQRGNMVQDDQIDSLMTGFHTRYDVLSKLGSPTAVAPFDENVWYYIGQETSKKGILDPKVVEERVVMVRFDDAGTLQEVTPQEGGRLDIPVERSKTATHGNDVTVMQQLLGNLGKFNSPGQTGSGL